MPDSPTGKKLYRLAYFNRSAKPPRIAIQYGAELRGCLVYVRDTDKKRRRVRFSESHCPAASVEEEVNGLTDFIGYARNIEVEDE